MEPVVSWALVVGLCIFGIGLSSAIGSRRKDRTRIRTTVLKTTKVRAIEKTEAKETAMSMAARGLVNLNEKEDEFAPTGSATR